MSVAVDIPRRAEEEEEEDEAGSPEGPWQVQGRCGTDRAHRLIFFTWDRSRGGCWRLHSYFIFLFFCRTSAAVAMGKLVLVSGHHNHQAEILKPWCRGFAIPVTLLQFSDSC